MRSLLLVLTILVALRAGDCQWQEIVDQFEEFMTNMHEKKEKFSDYVLEKENNFKKFVDDKQKSINQYIDGVKINLVNTLGLTKNQTSIEKRRKPPPRYEDSKALKARQALMKRQVQELLETNSVQPTIQPFKPPVKVDDDPRNHMSTPQLIALHGYKSESHTIVTEDGYILTVHRIPAIDSRKFTQKKTVLLHHGLLGSSADWVISGPGKGLAYLLSDSGYDVWMANVRGNTYSKAHLTKSVNSFSFWNFTFHEVAMYDVPAVVDYILHIKGYNANINYIGHSMGSTVLFVLLSMKPRYNTLLRAGFALAPVAYMTDVRSPLTMLSRFANDFGYLLKLFGTYEFLPQNAVLRWLSRYGCEINQYEEEFCENSMFVICGHDPKQFNSSLLPMILGHNPAGASTKTLIHYAQEIRAKGLFQQFDYGFDGNLREYGTELPPEYPLERVTAPIILFGAKNDWLAGDADVMKLSSKLKNLVEHYEVPYKEFNHLDFLWAKEAPTLVYDKLLQLLGDRIPSKIADVRANSNENEEEDAED